MGGWNGAWAQFNARDAPARGVPGPARLWTTLIRCVLICARRAHHGIVFCAASPINLRCEASMLADICAFLRSRASQNVHHTYASQAGPYSASGEMIAGAPINIWPPALSRSHIVRATESGFCIARRRHRPGRGRPVAPEPTKGAKPSQASRRSAHTAIPRLPLTPPL